MSKRMKIEGMTEIMAQRMKDSWETSPKVTYSMSACVDCLNEFMEKMNNEQEKGKIKITYNHILMKACALASKKYELFNSSVEGNEIVIHDNVNIGLAVATDSGLIVPNVKNAEELSLEELCTEAGRIIKGAREMKLNYDDICGGTFTITNLGMFGIESFTPIINQPEVAILGVNKVCRRLVSEDGRIAEKHYMPLNLVADHRIIDGALAARYLNEVKDYMENPEKLVKRQGE